MTRNVHQKASIESWYDGRLLSPGALTLLFFSSFGGTGLLELSALFLFVCGNGTFEFGCGGAGF
jgi:hypothetical protein